ncbi:YtnP family quorum-quenching lactonase [Staphylococcus massiliensis]|uniref:Metallo-beta-lactamase domain-containing protein n=1 Tax=Staphylococcus massiliensis S46 TaxID=1229783 RepID=K9AS57_9STAP|nr:MBL fold metallo-hydrolase [Staphylococcus massiliensis]EKU50258.1 hypothetical protein C273_01410 [Staphylococcus massiliensis S46]
MKLGQFSINPLNGGATMMDGGAMFGVVPKPLWTKKYDVNDKNQVHLPTHPILIQTPDHNNVIDAGMGNDKLTEKEIKIFGVEESRIHQSLEHYGLTVDDIDIVIMTHLHFDHAVGLTNTNGERIFKNATHFIQQDEWHEFLSPNIRSKATYWEKNQGDFKDHMILFDQAIDVIEGIRLVHTGGHSYGHSMVMIESDGEKAVHMADIFPTVAHLNPLWVTAYDDYPMQSIREKERLIRNFIQQDYWFLYYHDESYFAAKFQVDFKTVKEAIKRQDALK